MVGICNMVCRDADLHPAESRSVKVTAHRRRQLPLYEDLAQAFAVQDAQSHGGGDAWLLPSERCALVYTPVVPAIRLQVYSPHRS